MGARTDEELMELFLRYAPLVHRLMRRGYRSEHDAQDLTQQVFLQVHRARKDYRPPRPVRPWIVTIARNVLRDRIRQERRRPAALPLVEEPPTGGSAQDDVERREAIAGALRRLPRTLRTVIEARWLRQKSYGEIARELGISAAAARVRAHRGYRALRCMLEERGLQPP
jgi:RNA polymerase sigma-70 factor (ECF subfamily)